MTDLYQMKVRLNSELKAFLEEQAKLNYRTLNGQIIYFLEQIKQCNKYQDIKK